MSLGLLQFMQGMSERTGQGGNPWSVAAPSSNAGGGNDPNFTGALDNGMLLPPLQPPDGVPVQGGYPMYDPQQMQQQLGDQAMQLASGPMGGGQGMGVAPQQARGTMENPLQAGQVSQRDVINDKAQQGFGSLWNMQGTPEQPNLFLRLAEGYNRGGLIGSIGNALTRY